MQTNPRTVTALLMTLCLLMMTPAAVAQAPADALEAPCTFGTVLDRVSCIASLIVSKGLEITGAVLSLIWDIVASGVGLACDLFPEVCLI